jgi:peptidoglycan/xylan/chitin deacetylase (PgdA/CDA1 family)
MTLKSIAEKAARALGAVDLVRHRNRANVRILMYHRFHGDLARLTAQCEHLSRHYHSISLTELADAARENRPLPNNSLAITVDDGYHDFKRAFPIFREFGLKTTLYVVSGFASGDLWLWPDQLLYLFENTPLAKAAIRAPGGTTHIDFSNPVAAFDSFSQALIRMSNQDRLNVLDSLPTLLETDLPAKAPERFASLSWSELGDLAAEGLDIGGHTATHPILSRLERSQELEPEILGSKLRIEEATGATVRHFCYPNGKLADVSSEAERMAERSGYQTSVLAEPGFAGPPFELHQLRRLGIDPEFPLLYFERFVAGYKV